MRVWVEGGLRVQSRNRGPPGVDVVAPGVVYVAQDPSNAQQRPLAPRVIGVGMERPAAVLFRGPYLMEYDATLGWKSKASNGVGLPIV